MRARRVRVPARWAGLATARRVAGLAAFLTSVVVAGWVLRGSWGTGQYLFRDFVAVPEPVRPETLLPTTSAALRAWPLDGVSWALSVVVPTGLQQAVVLGACLVLAGTGAGVLVGRHGVGAATAAAGVAVWNPYVTERLLLGQVPTLLGYAALPWVLLVARAEMPLARRLVLLLLAAAPAALTPWGGLVALVAAVAGSLSRRGRSRGEVIAVAGVGLTWCLPWAVPGLLAGGSAADPDGATAFALADDSGLGTWASALFGGGVWAEAARPLSRQDPLALTASVLVVLFALCGAAMLWRSTGPKAGLLALGLVLAPATVLTMASGPLLPLMTSAQAVPGVALFRDQHRLLAPGVLAGAVLLGSVVGAVSRHGGRVAAGGAALLAVVLAVTTVPDLPVLSASTYQPRHYPQGWAAAVSAVASVDTGTGQGRVLSLPWQPLRATTWSGGRAFLDPLPRAVGDSVLASSTLSIRRDGGVIEVDDAPVADGPAWLTGEVSAASLQREGVTVVVEWLGTPGTLPRRHDGWRLVTGTPDFRVWDVTSAR